MRKVVAVAFVTLLVACTSGNERSSKPKVPQTMNMFVDLRLSGKENVRGSISNCAGVGKYVDLFKDQFVTIADRDQKPISLAKLSIVSGTGTYQGYLDECSFQFRALNVSKSSDYYFLVGRQPAKMVTHEEMLRKNGHFAYDLNVPNIPPPTTRPG